VLVSRWVCMGSTHGEDEQVECVATAEEMQHAARGRFCSCVMGAGRCVCLWTAGVCDLETVTE
jgi:hypothetical protein